MMKRGARLAADVAATSGEAVDEQQAGWRFPPLERRVAHFWDPRVEIVAQHFVLRARVLLEFPLVIRHLARDLPRRDRRDSGHGLAAGAGSGQRTPALVAALGNNSPIVDDQWRARLAHQTVELISTRSEFVS